MPGRCRKRSLQRSSEQKHSKGWYFLITVLQAEACTQVACSDEGNPGTKERCCDSLKIQTKWQVILSINWNVCGQSDILSITKLVSVSHKPNKLWTALLPEPLSTGIPFQEEHFLCAPTSVPKTRQYVPCVGAKAKIIGHPGGHELVSINLEASVCLVYSCLKMIAPQVTELASVQV